MQALTAPTIDAELASSVADAAACENAGQHDHTAEFAAVCRGGCGVTLLLCGKHLDHLRLLIVKRSAAGERFGCVLCRTEAETLDAVFDVDSLH